MTDKEKIAALEAEVARLQKMIDKCQWYWAENDAECYGEDCAESAYEAVYEDSGQVIRIDRGGVVSSSYCAIVEYDDGSTVFVEEPTMEAALAKVQELQGEMS